MVRILVKTCSKARYLLNLEALGTWRRLIDIPMDLADQIPLGYATMRI